MNKQVAITHTGMSQDAARSKTVNNLYYEALNARITSSDDSSNGVLTNDKGNSFLFKIPLITVNSELKNISYLNTVLEYENLRLDKYSTKPDLNNQIIIGNVTTKYGFVFITTNNNGVDCIWEIMENLNNPILRYLGDLKLSENNPVQILNNYENEQIDKIYFIDGKEQLRFLNLRHSVKNYDSENLIDLDESILNIVSDVVMEEPQITDMLYGGTHTSGAIQYAYSYYKVNGSQSRLSPMSSIIPLGKSETKGGDLNEVVGAIPKVVINNLDNKFTNIRLYSIKYTSFNELPTISLIADRDISGENDFIYFDEGRIIQNITIEEILFLSNGFIIPKHIETKDNRLFFFNYRDRVYNLNQRENNLDLRAYSFPQNSTITKVYDRITEYPVTSSDYTLITHAHLTNSVKLEETHSAINSDMFGSRFQYNSSIVGGEGPFLKYEIIRTSKNKDGLIDFRFFKEHELYRIGLQFYNKYGIKSNPMWIADFLVNGLNIEDHNLNGRYAGIKITFKPEFFVWLNTSSNFLNEVGEYDAFLKPVGLKLLRAERTPSDRTIIAQGLINGMLSHTKLTGTPPAELGRVRANEGLKIPSLMRRFDDYLCPMFGNETYARLDGRTKHPQWNGLGSPREGASEEVFSYTNGRRGSTYQFNQLMQLYSPEILFNIVNTVNSTKFKILGGAVNSYNGVKARFENWSTGEMGDFEVIDDALSAYDYKANVNDEDFIPWVSLGTERTGWRGIYGPVFIHEDDGRKKAMASQYFRDYSNSFILNKNIQSFDLYGKPEIADFKSNSKKYNNDPELSYTTSMEPLVSDVAGDDNDSKTDNTSIKKVLASSVRSAVFALGDEDLKTEERLKIEDLYRQTSFYKKLPTESAVNNVYSLNWAVSTYDDLLAFGNFDYLNIGVLETGNVYSKNNVYEPVASFNFNNVVGIFPTLKDYDSLTNIQREFFVGKRIAIGDKNWSKYNSALVNNIKVYDVLTPLESQYSSLQSSSIMFNSVHPLLLSCDKILRTKAEMNAIPHEELPTDVNWRNYRVAVLNDEKVYEWTMSAGQPKTYSFQEYSVIRTLDFQSSVNYQGGVGLIGEFINEESLIYIGNYYGGNSYESKRKTIYVEASNYFDLINSNDVLTVVNPGDTFVQDYSIARISKLPYDKPPESSEALITEIIKIKLESTVNQNKRNDESTDEWTSTFFPSQGDYHAYNRVYSQDPSLIKSTSLSYEIKINERFNTAIMSSMLKRPGETIDNWTKFSINDTLFVDGKYGAINGVIKARDQIFTFQDSAVARIEINPRVQLNASDGVGIQLGTGDVLHDYRYLTTTSGALNKWGLISTNSGIFYYDALNNMIGLIGEDVRKLSDLKGLHSFMFKNIDSNIIRKDNHILKQGVTMGYDYFNNDVYLTFLQGDKSKTLCFSEVLSEFISLHSFKPSFYFNKGSIFLTTSPKLQSVYKHDDSIYNMYYDEYHPTYVQYSLNPEPGQVCIFNNLDFKSEVSHYGEDQVGKTITQIRAFNEYQDSGMKPLIVGRNGNIRRKFRDWNLEIPRQGRDRMRNPWLYLHLQFDNFSNDKLILHDIVISYTI